MVKMNKSKAKKIVKTFESNYYTDSKSIHRYVEAIKYLSSKGDPNATLTYGLILEHFGRYKLAGKIYSDLVKSSVNNKKILGPACTSLGWINLQINKNVSLAYYNFLESAHQGFIIGKYYIALMYKKGVFVNKNYERYKDIIMNHCSAQYSDIVSIEKVKIYKNELNIDKCIEAIEDTGLICSPTVIWNYDYFEGTSGIKDMIKIKELANEYNLIKDDDIELYNLPIYFNKTNLVIFYYFGKEYKILKNEHNGEKYYCFQSKNFRNFEELMAGAEIGNKPLFTLNKEITTFVINGKRIQRKDNKTDDNNMI